MSKESATKNDAAASPLVQNLKQQKAAKTGTRSTVLPNTGVNVTWPEFRSHGEWMKAQRHAKNDVTKATNFYLVSVCSFAGEQMTITDFLELIPSGDILHLTAEVIGDGVEDEDEESLGNRLH